MSASSRMASRSARSVLPRSFLRRSVVRSVVCTRRCCRVLEAPAIGFRRPEPPRSEVLAGEHADDGLAEAHAATGAGEPGVTEGEDAAVGSDEAVAAAGLGWRHADDRLVEADVAGRAEELGVTE